MSAARFVRALGLGALGALGALGLTLSLDGLIRVLRRLRPKGFLKEVLFFPTEVACLEHVFIPTSHCPCLLPHGLETSLSRLLRHILSANSTLDLCIFSFSNTDLSRAVLALHARGLAVRILTDRDYASINGSQFGPLRRAGVCVRCDGSAVHMHHKFALVDGRRLLSGSLNWTRTAVQNNKENVLVTEEPDLVLPFIREFQRLWEANDPELPHPPTPSPLRRDV